MELTHRLREFVTKTPAFGRGDFWAYAGIYAVKKTVLLSNNACIRPDCKVPEPGKGTILKCLC